MSFSICAVKAIGELNNPLANVSSKKHIFQFLWNHPVLVWFRHWSLTVQPGFLGWFGIPGAQIPFVTSGRAWTSASTSRRCCWEQLQQNLWSCRAALPQPLQMVGFHLPPCQHQALLGLGSPGASQGAGKGDAGAASLSTQRKFLTVFPTFTSYITEIPFLSTKMGYNHHKLPQIPAPLAAHPSQPGWTPMLWLLRSLSHFHPSPSHMDTVPQELSKPPKLQNPIF